MAFEQVEADGIEHEEVPRSMACAATASALGATAPPARSF
jgi:hypothetical protein